ncbi:MAG: hypothetical protein AB7F86_04280 [Bdellovibrionales bacterium]
MSAKAYEPGGFFVDPHLAVGFNSAQGTHYHAGVDLGYGLSEQMAVGAGAYYSAGEHPSHGREIGGGPFWSYLQPITSFLVGSLKQEILYVDMFNPIETQTVSGSTYSHTRETGIASASTAGFHFHFMPFGFSVGYRLMIGLTNDKLDNGRSGFFAGFSIGI